MDQLLGVLLGGGLTLLGSFGAVWSFDRILVPETSSDPVHRRLIDAEKSAREELMAHLRAELDVDRYLPA
ncbi:hypothetical protein [Streptomyces sp. NPDC003401]